MIKKTWFERAIFLSWYCSKGDCKFCYMSMQKDRIKEPRRARRKRESILAEAMISKACRWRIEFLSGGYDSYSVPELVELTKDIHRITGQKQWLNIGTLKKSEIKQFLPHIEGICGAVECINPNIRREVCPSKPLAPIIKMFRDAESLGLKKTITIIIGLGETEKDIPLLLRFIRENKIDRITLYALNPHKGTIFKKGPATKYYIKWIKEIRENFPKLQIIAGSWVNRFSEIHILLEAGADAITKFPAINLFGTKYARQIEAEAKRAGREFEGTLTRLPKIDIDKEVESLNLDDNTKRIMKEKLSSYISKMKK